MKRETKQWLRSNIGHPRDDSPLTHTEKCAIDALDSDARLRAEVKRLRAHIKAASGITCRALRHICEDGHPGEDFDPECAWCQIQEHLRAALKPSRKP